jgi:hypothetical protein
VAVGGARSPVDKNRTSWKWLSSSCVLRLSSFLLSTKLRETRPGSFSRSVVRAAPRGVLSGLLVVRAACFEKPQMQVGC